MSIDLNALGFTKEELQERVINLIASQVMEGSFRDEDGEEYTDNSEFSRRLNKKVAEKVDQEIQAIAERHVLPNVANFIETLCLQETNKWGEKTGNKMTFTEYLVSRAESYMTELVSFDGKSKGSDSYSWKGTQTRLTHLVNQHLHYSIENAMKDALRVANSQIAKGIEETVKLKLADITQSLQVTAKIK